MKKVETIKFSSFFSIHLNISFDKLQYVFFIHYCQMIQSKSSVLFYLALIFFWLGCFFCVTLHDKQ